MNISWTTLAMANLKVYYEFHKKNKGIPYARQWRKAIFEKTNHLVNFPRIGRKEDSEFHPNEEIRSILEGNYRVYYRIEGQDISILNIFDTRQSPDRLVF